MIKSLLLSLCLYPLLHVAPELPVAASDKKTEVMISSDDHEKGDVSEYWIAPNPSSDFLDLYTSVRATDGLTVRVYNIVGKELKVLYPETSGSDMLLHEDATSWLPGTYLVRIEVHGTVLKTMRFVRR